MEREIVSKIKEAAVREA